ncbi:MAG: PH domain-containing protein [Flavisolibacter sp.]
MEAENTICEISPSQLLNLKAFTLSIIGIAVVITAAILAEMNMLLVLLVIPVGYALWKWLVIKNTILKITDQRIILREGVLNKRTNETELYRVRDSTIEEPLFYRLFGCGNIIIFTTDEADATLKLTAFKKPHWLKDQVRNYAEICRQKKRWGADNILLHDHPDQQ